MEDTQRPKRKSVRFIPDPNTLVYIKRSTSDSPNIDSIGLVSVEAGKGFYCISLPEGAPTEGETCLVKVGELHAMKAKVTSVISLDKEGVKLGFEYLE